MERRRDLPVSSGAQSGAKASDRDNGQQCTSSGLPVANQSDSLNHHLMGDKIKLQIDGDNGKSDRISGDQNEATDCFGQLVLNVDFAPPKQSEPNEPTKAHHLIEVSLGIKQTCSNDLESGQYDRDQAAGIGKRRLVYERIDRFPLELAESRLLAGLDSAGPAKSSAPSACLVAVGQVGGFVLPFKSDSFDACFCFNLLNVRLASKRLLSIECSEPDGASSDALGCPKWAGSLEFDWLKMSRLTNELRLQILRELSRVVKARGK